MKSLFRLQDFGPQVVAVMLLGGSLLAIGGPAIAQRSVQLRLPNISAPGNRESGSTRSTSCVAPQDNLVALIPQSNYGLTQSAYPTFYFYLPETTAEHVKFVLLNETTNELVYESRLRVAGTSGIASIHLPDNGIQQPLAIGETYVWYIAVICDPFDPSADVVTEGQIARVEPLAAATDTLPTALPALYAEAGLWYDALAASAALKQDDRTSEWNTLLAAVDLNDLIPVELLRASPSPAARSTPVME